MVPAGTVRLPPLSRPEIRVFRRPQPVIVGGMRELIDDRFDRFSEPWSPKKLVAGLDDEFLAGP